MPAKRHSVPPTFIPDADAAGPWELTKREKREVVGLLARDRELQQLARPLQKDMFEYKREIEERLGFEVGALDSTHEVNFDLGIVVKLELPAPPTADADASAQSAPDPGNGEVDTETAVAAVTGDAQAE